MHLRARSLGVECFRNRVIECVSLSELVVVVFWFIALFEVQVVVGEEVVVILRAYNLILQFLFDIFVGIVEGGLVLSELPVIIFVIEVFWAKMGPLGGWIPEFL